MAGRKPLPTHLKLVKGTARPHRLNKAEPKPTVAVPEPPGHLDERARAKFATMAAMLARHGVMTELDAGMQRRRPAQAVLADHRERPAATAPEHLAGEQAARPAAVPGVLADDARFRRLLSHEFAGIGEPALASHHPPSCQPHHVFASHVDQPDRGADAAGCRCGTAHRALRREPDDGSDRRG
jgi:hypothetical protein